MSSFVKQLKKDRLMLVGIVLAVILLGVASIVSRKKEAPVADNMPIESETRVILTDAERDDLVRAMSAPEGERIVLTPKEREELIKAMSASGL